MLIKCQLAVVVNWFDESCHRVREMTDDGCAEADGKIGSSLIG